MKVIIKNKVKRSDAIDLFSAEITPNITAGLFCGITIKKKINNRARLLKKAIKKKDLFKILNFSKLSGS